MLLARTPSILRIFAPGGGALMCCANIFAFCIKFYVVSVHFHLKDISGPKLALPHKGFPPTMSACIVWQISKSDVGREGSAQMSTSVRTSTLCRLRKKNAVEQQLGSKAVTWMTEPGPAIFRPLQESWPLMTRLTGSPTRSFQA